MTEQPVVMQCEADGNPAACEEVDDRGRQTGQVMEVGNVGPKLIDQTGCDRLDFVVCVGLVEAAGCTERVVKPGDT